MATIPVIIIGAGPVGLATSMALSRQGIRNVVIEKHPSTSIHPKARGVNMRTMELCRQWQTETAIRSQELDASARRFLWMSNIQGEIHGNVPLAPLNEDVSPTSACMLAQDIFEEKFLKCLQAQALSQVRFNTEVVDIEQTDDLVYCNVYDRVHDTQIRMQCQYLVACDGAKSFVRKLLGIAMEGIECLGNHASVYCETELPWLADKPFAVMTFTDEEQMGRFMMAVDLKHKWLFGKRLADASETLDTEQAIELVRATAGKDDLAVKVLNISKWEMAALNATHYRQDRIFLAGDAAHRIPPTGGMGMNTGIGDAHNLAWKLAYVLHGYADESLLVSYEQERKTLAQTTIDWSCDNASRLRAIFESIADGNENAFQDGLTAQRDQINHTGLDIGFIYQSDALYPAKDAETEFDCTDYEFKAVVGMRAPHCWVLHDGERVSTVDLFETDYVLIVGEDASDDIALPIPESYPLTRYRIGRDLRLLEQDIYQRFAIEKDGAVLVRPDGHVVWIA